MMTGIPLLNQEIELEIKELFEQTICLKLFWLELVPEVQSTRTILKLFLLSHLVDQRYGFEKKNSYTLWKNYLLVYILCTVWM